MTKQFHQMTRTEFVDHYLREAYRFEYGSMEGFELWLKSPLSRQEVSIATCNADDDHYDIIAGSLADGLEIPKIVLRDYPELRKEVMSL